MIWCVEDDASIRDIALYALNSTGFQARGFEDGQSLIQALKNETPDLILLDIMLPGIDGVALLDKLKKSPDYCAIPIIMTTAKGTEYDKIQSLDLGADDYLVKPFGMLEMIARIKAVLRRCNQKTAPSILEYDALKVYLEERRVMIDNKTIQLTYKEFELLKLFLSAPKITHTRAQLFTQVWDSDYMGDSRTLDMHIRTLRQKLGEYGKIIETVRNAGYRLEHSHEQ